MFYSKLRNLFVSFIQSRGLGRNFRSLLLLDGLNSSSASKSVPPELAKKLISASRSETEALFQAYHSHPDGLTSEQSQDYLKKYGPNVVEGEKPLTWQVHLWQCYRTPFNLLLTLLAIVSYLTDDMAGTTVISTMVVIAIIVRFWQERKSIVSADRLKAMVRNTATVLRRDMGDDIINVARNYFDVQLHPKPAHKVEVPIDTLVPGDIIYLSAGDMIPADCRLLTAKDLFIAQAAMTGESLPVEKFASHQSAANDNPLEFDNLVFMGTNVVSGSATAIVVSTGASTYFGLLAQSITKVEREPTQFQMGVNKVAWLLLRFMFVMTPLVLIFNGVTKHDWKDAFLFAISVAVGLTPEMLPMIVTSTLAKGAVALSRMKVIVKRLDAIQNFGAMDVLCTDKTGTLTQDKICLSRHTDIWGESSDDVLKMAYLNSYHQTGLKNLLDVAVLDHTQPKIANELRASFRKLDEVPFDFQRRRMSVVVENQQGSPLLICKGAVEEMLNVCTKARHGAVDEELTPALLADLLSVTGSLNAEGLRVVAVAAKTFSNHNEAYSVADESELTLIGYVAFLDPPKDSTAPALKALGDYGVAVKVLTGDNELVTTKICSAVQLQGNPIPLLGSQVENMTDEELSKAVEAHVIFAKLTPMHKERIVRMLKANGHVVGFMGDGINDAPALRASDIGISVDTAVDIAKEAADIILLEKSLMVLENGVLEGRRTFANMTKYIRMAASSNFGNVFSVLVASLALPFLPMLPLQILVQNLLYDISQIAIPFDNVDEELIKKPQRWNPGEIGRFMLIFGPTSSIFDVLTFVLMWFVFKANSPEHQILFQSAWFIEGLLTQTLVVHMIRTKKIPFFQSWPSPALLLSTFIIMAIGLLIPMTFVSQYFSMQALPWTFFPYLIMILIAYMALTQVVKSFYVKRFGWQ